MLGLRLTPRPASQAEHRDRAGSFVLSLAYSPDGRRLACGTMDGTVAVFDVATAKLMHTLVVRRPLAPPGNSGGDIHT